jgi:hypothetical protein
VTVTEQSTTVQTTLGITITTPTATTPAPEPAATESSGTPTWVWVLAAVAAVLILVGIVLAFRSRKPKELPPEERRRILAGAVGSWIAQGWAIESQTEDTAVVRRAAERVAVTVDLRGRVTTFQPLDPPPGPIS